MCVDRGVVGDHATVFCIVEDALLTVQTSIRAPRRLVEPKQASTRMDTLGVDTNAS